MDCCDKNDKKKMDEPKHENLKDKKSRAKKTFMWVIIGVLLIGTVFLTIKASTGTTQTTTSSPGKIDTSTMTADEKMNYEMHGIVPARFQGQLSATGASTASGASQVGGC